jgi:hypothetical protein
MKTQVLLCILFFIASCSPKDEKYYSITDVIAINNFSIPDSTKVFDTIQIHANAQEPNSCWSNLNFVLSKDSDYNYNLEAFGTFTNNGGLCPAQIINKDTILYFQPILKGRYLFHVLKDPLTIVNDTLLVK